MAPKRSAKESTPAPAAVASTPSKPAAKTTTVAGNQPWDQMILNLTKYYDDNTPQRTKLIDVFMAFLVLVGGLQFLYCVVAGNYVRNGPANPVPIGLPARVKLTWGPLAIQRLPVRFLCYSRSICPDG